MKREHIGSDFDGFLQERGLLAVGEAGALKRVVAGQIEREMKRRRMKNSAAKLDSVSAADQSAATVELLEQAAVAFGRKLKIGLA